MTTNKDRRIHSFRLTDKEVKILQKIADKYGADRSWALRFIIKNFKAK